MTKPVLTMFTLMMVGTVAATADVPVYAYPALRAVMQRMAEEKPTTVAFLGGSITWGATATDPLRTSWRALLERELRSRYLRTPLTAVDAAIGGQPSRLGVFRMDRDVLPYEPDLYFVEFAVNDWSAPGSAETMEGIIRKRRARRSDMAIIIVVIGANWAYDESPARKGHLALAARYGLPVADIYAAVRHRIETGLSTHEILTDGCHPNDQGYRFALQVILAEDGTGFEISLAHDGIQENLPRLNADAKTANEYAEGAK